MGWPDDAPPGADMAAPPNWKQRLLQRYGDPLLTTGFVSAGVGVWTVAVAFRGLGPRWGMLSGLLVTMGLFALLRPAWGFTFGERWAYREEPEPSRAFLVVTRVVGALLLGGGLVLGLLASPSAYGPSADGATGVRPSSPAALLAQCLLTAGTVSWPARAGFRYLS